MFAYSSLRALSDATGDAGSVRGSCGESCRAGHVPVAVDAARGYDGDRCEERHDDGCFRFRQGGRHRPPGRRSRRVLSTNAGELQAMIDRQMNHARRLVSSLAPRLPQGAPKAVIVPHAGYVYSGSVAALAYALLERAPHSARRAGRARSCATGTRYCPTASDPTDAAPTAASGSRPLVRGRRI